MLCNSIFIKHLIRSVQGTFFLIFFISVYPSCVSTAGGSRGPCMNELWLSHSEFTICCSARVPGRCQTREVDLMLVTQAHLSFYYFFIIHLHSSQPYFSWSLFKLQFVLQSPRQSEVYFPTFGLSENGLKKKQQKKKTFIAHN